MSEYSFTVHARREMTKDQITEEGVYHVIGDADDVVVHDDGRTRYTGMWQGRTFVVIVENDGRTVITVWQPKWRRPRRR